MLRRPARLTVLAVLLTAAVLTTIPPSGAADTGLGWAEGFGASGWDAGFDIAVDGTGNPIAVGVFEGSVDFDPSPETAKVITANAEDAFITKFAPNGTHAWTRKIGGPGDESAAGVAVDRDGNVYVTGTFTEPMQVDFGAFTLPHTNPGWRDIFVAKLRPDGEFLWVKAIAGIRNEFPGTIDVDFVGNVFIGGRFEDTVDFDPGPGTVNLTSGGSYDGFVVKLDTDGNHQWAGRMGGASWLTIDSIAVNNAGYTYATGGFSGTADFDPGAGTHSETALGFDGFVLKLEPDGVFNRVTRLGSAGGESGGNAIAIDGAGGAYVCGTLKGTVDFDPGPGVVELTDTGNYDAYVVALSPAGQVRWGAGTGSPSSSDYGFGIDVDVQGSVYAVGHFAGPSDFDPGPGVRQIDTHGIYDGWVWKLDGNGDLLWVVTVGGTESDVTRGIAVDSAHTAYVTGQFADTVDFDPTRGKQILSSAGNSDAFVWKLEDTTGPVVDLRVPAAGDVFPPMATPKADYSCSDRGSGLQSCVGSVADGAPLDMSNGLHTFSVTATDWAGNTTTVSHTYSVDDTCGGLAVTIHGTVNDETLTGTPGPDVIRGYGGDDVIEGKGGDDRICGDLGDDLLLGGPGDDWIWGGGDNDKLRGASGDDHLYGEAGSDRLLPEAGNDHLDGGAGSDIADYLAADGPIDIDLGAGISIYTPPGESWTHTLVRIEKVDGTPYGDLIEGDGRRNVLRGKHGNDVIFGHDGPDDLIGGLDDDQIHGDGGDDLIKGQGDDDLLWGGAGDDTIRGGHGNDWLWGEDGADRLWGGLIIHHHTFTNHLDGGAGIDTCRWDFDPQTNCNP